MLEKNGNFICSISSATLSPIRHSYLLLNEWMSNLYWNVPGFKETAVYENHPSVNPIAVNPPEMIPQIESFFEEDGTKLKADEVKCPNQ
ncbi:unnamed protein product [Diplocarpon coronariae]